VGSDDNVEVLVAHVPQDLVAQHSGVGDHHVQSPELAHCAVDHGLRRVSVADRRDLADGTSPGVGD